MGCCVRVVGAKSTAAPGYKRENIFLGYINKCMVLKVTVCWCFCLRFFICSLINVLSYLKYIPISKKLWICYKFIRDLVAGNNGLLGYKNKSGAKY